MNKDIDTDPMDALWMGEALELAQRAASEDEVPVGAVVVKGDLVVGRGWNRNIGLNDPSAHAEIMAMREAGALLGNHRLVGCSLYVTLEPCPMCAGALVNARIDRLVFGATDPKAGACGTLYDIPCDERLNHRFESVGGVLAEEAGGLLTTYFAEKRRRTKRGNGRL